MPTLQPPGTVRYWTDAPGVYDWGFTREIFREISPPDPRRENQCKVYRLVETPDARVKEQQARYSSGMFCSWNAEQYAYHRQTRG